MIYRYAFVASKLIVYRGAGIMETLLILGNPSPYGASLIRVQ